MDRNLSISRPLAAVAAATCRSSRTWHVVQLKPGGAVLAERNLVRQGFETFFPRTSSTRRRGDRLTTRSEPLFPGYGFVALDPGASWAPINHTYGVLRLLMESARRPARLPSGFIEAVTSRCGCDGDLIPPPDLAPGDVVRVIAGPFRDLITRIERLEPLNRVTVLLEILGQSVPIRLRAADLESEVAARS